MRRIIVAIILLSSLLFSDYDRYEEHEYHLPKDLRHLELSQQQHRDVKAVLKKYRSALMKLRRDQHETAKEIETLFTRDDFDKKRYIELGMRYEKLSFDIEADMLHEIHTLLTPAQRKRFLRYIDEWTEQ